MFKKIIAGFTLFVYFFFSQFVIKAYATTTQSDSGSESFCVNKNLKTLDSKHGCWEKNNTAYFGNIFDYLPFLAAQESSTTHTQIFDLMQEVYPATLGFSAQAPPGENKLDTTIFAHNYVGVILLLF